MFRRRGTPFGLGEKESSPAMLPTVFVSYSRGDKKLKERLVEQLGVLKSQLTTWDDSRLEPGTDWLPEIEAAMASAQVAVMLISSRKGD